MNTLDEIKHAFYCCNRSYSWRSCIHNTHKINSREGCDDMPKCTISMIVFVAKGEREATKREENHQHWNNMHVFR